MELEQQAQSLDATTELGKICPACSKRYPTELTKCPADNSLLATHKGDQLVGTVIADRYEIQTLIGSGGWSRVYKARHAGLNKTVAVKTMHQHMAGDLDKILRFQQEAEAVARLSHQNICAVHDYGLLPSNQPYLIMDYLEGRTLADFIQTQDLLPVKTCLTIFEQACLGLSEAHGKGIVHRDIKPTNLMLIESFDREPVVKVLDFGLAKVTHPDGTSLQSITATGETIGTPAYMSPEQCTGAPLDARSDIYSFGCVMYETLIGKPPVAGTNPFDCMTRHIHEMPPSFTEVNNKHQIPAALEDIVFKALEKEPDKRFQTVDEVLDALRKVEVSGGRAKVSKRTSPKKKTSKVNWVQILAVVALIGVGGWLANQVVSHQKSAGNEHAEKILQLNDVDALLASANEFARRTGDYGSAEAAFNKAYALARQKYGERSQKMAEVCYTLGSSYREHQRYDRAALMLEKAATLREELVGLNDIQTANYLREVGDLYLTNLNNYPRAETWLQKALQSCKMAFGENGVGTAGALQSLALAEMKGGKSAAALKHAAAAVDIMAKEMPLDSPQTIAAFSQLATVQQEAGELKEAQATMLRCVKGLSPGVKTKQAAAALSSAVVLCMRNKDYKGAVEVARRLNACADKAYAPSEAEYADARKHLAMSLAAASAGAPVGSSQRLDLANAAVKAFAEFDSIIKAQRRMDDPSLADAYAEYARVAAAVGDKATSERAAQISKTLSSL